MNRVLIAAALVSAVLFALGLAGSASAVTPACAQALTTLTTSQTALAEARATDKVQQGNVDEVRAHRQDLINAGDVEGVGRDNVKLGSLTAIANTTDSAVASARARAVRDTAAKKVACG